MKRAFYVFLILAILAVAVGPVFAAPAERSYLLLGVGNRLPRGLADKVADAGGTLTNTIPEIGIAVASSASSSFSNDAAAIRGIGAVAPNVRLQWIDPEYQIRLDDEANPPSIGDDEPLFYLQWAPDAINAPEAWNEGAFGGGATVAILDGGFDLDHPDLLPNINFGLSQDFTGEGLQYDYTRNPDDDVGVFSHGSHVAGIVAAADNAFGTIGVAPEAELMLVKVLGDSGSGYFDWVISGIVHAAMNGADVINMSLGAYLIKSGFCTTTYCVTAEEVQELKNAVARATTYAYQLGTTVVASAGNDSIDFDHTADFIHIPSDCPNVISVSATGPLGWALDPSTDLDVPAFFTNYGQSAIDFAAPGGNVDFSLFPTGPWFYDLVFSTGNDGWYWGAGTSQAAPHVSGVAALIIAENGGDMHPAQVEAALAASADDLGKPGNDDYYGAGRVNAYNAVK